MGLERILVVDDSESWRKMYQWILESRGYTVTVATDFESALRELKNHFYPVVVVDLRLAGDWDAEGLRLIQEMDRLWPLAVVHKIIVCGWQLSPDETQRITQAVRGGSVSFVAKGGESEANRLRFLATVWHAFARVRGPIHCFFSNEDCKREIEPTPSQIFVAMPYVLKSSGITANMDDVYLRGIRPALRDVGYTAVRSDKVPFLGALICNVCRGIQESVLCIADITDWNANVLFELGLMYGWGKPTIILKHAKSEVPTDLRFALYVEYDGIDSLQSRLKKLIKGLEEQPRSVQGLQ